MLLEENAKLDLTDSKGKVKFVDDPYEAVVDADAIAVIIEWDLYKNLDYQIIYNSMNKPVFIFDGLNILDKKILESIGYQLKRIG